MGGGNNGTNNTVNPKSKARIIFKIALIGTSDRKKSLFRVFVPVSVGDAFLKNKNEKKQNFLHKKNREKNETFRKIKREK
jgi:hypothetical protein